MCFGDFIIDTIQKRFQENVMQPCFVMNEHTLCVFE